MSRYSKNPLAGEKALLNRLDFPWSRRTINRITIILILYRNAVQCFIQNTVNHSIRVREIFARIAKASFFCEYFSPRTRICHNSCNEKHEWIRLGSQTRLSQVHRKIKSSRMIVGLQWILHSCISYWIVALFLWMHTLV